MTEIDRLQSGEVSATETLERCLSRIEEVDDTLRAFVSVTAESARAEAAAADAAFADGRLLGPLHGVPVGLKDNIDTAGAPTTRGSAHFLDHVPGADATVVRRLREAGAVLVGKLTMHELAYGATSQNEHTGPCRNPWDTSRIPGGSSGGSGVAVAAGEVVVALGTDTGGSVRIPASVNGVVGLRPTFGRVPVGGVFPIAPSFDAVGPLARDALDAARVLNVIGGYDADDPLSIAQPMPDFTDGLDAGVAGLRVGVPRGFFLAGVDVEVETLVRAAADALAGLGAHVVEIDVPGADRTHEAVTVIVRAEAYALHRVRIATRPELFGTEVLRRLRLAESISGADYADALTAGRAWSRSVERLFEHVDLVLTPTAPVPAPPASAHDMIETTQLLTRLTYAWSLSQTPCLSVPVGFTADGLPVGVQLAARRWDEATLLRVAHAYQQVTSWHDRRPPIG